MFDLTQKSYLCVLGGSDLSKEGRKGLNTLQQKVHDTDNFGYCCQLT